MILGSAEKLGELEIQKSWGRKKLSYDFCDRSFTKFAVLHKTSKLYF